MRKNRKRGTVMKRIMGIDYGDARTGVAISDLLCSIVGSTTVIPSRNREKAIADLVSLARETDVGQIVVGRPRNMDGTEGVRAVQRICRGIGKCHGLARPDVGRAAYHSRSPQHPFSA